MVIRDDQCNAHCAAKLCLGDRRNAAVHGDDQPHAVVIKLADRGCVQSIALLHASGNMRNAVRADGAQIIRQKAGCRNAVHIIVPKNGNALFFRQRAAKLRNGTIHLLH